MGPSRGPGPLRIVSGEEVLEYVDVGGMAIEKVRSFKYLGSHATERNEMDTEINYRIQAGNRCYFSLQSLMKHRGVSMATKLRTQEDIQLNHQTDSSLWL